MTTNCSSPSAVKPAPELLAPAGNWECARAAVENGADAIYFGLQVGFNARARAANFAMETLPQLMSMLHLRGVKGYVTLNTLVFTDELPSLEESVRQIAACGVDAVLVQDLGAARLLREICPDLSIHASTQMTMTCAESIEVARQLGVERVVLARELSIDEIRKIAASTDMPLETFVHGALCVAYSGQCLTSESLGGRSANRGQCAQACRLKYQLICDDQLQDLGDVQYLLSPQDLAAYDLIPQLIEAGICSLKIEGRLKTPEYVANIVQHYRRAIDSAIIHRPLRMSEQDRREMELSFSRGFSPGWLDGNNHKRLVPGKSSAKHGVLVGKVRGIRGERLDVDLSHPLAAGDGIVLEGDRAAKEEFGGRIYEVFQNGRLVDGPASGTVTLCFQHGLLKKAKIFPGQEVWQTDDPKLVKRLRATFDSPSPLRRLPIDLHLKVTVGEPLVLEAACDDGFRTVLTHDFLPPIAERHALTQESAEKQLGRLGGTAFQLRTMTLEVAQNPMVPLSVLGALRHELVQALDHLRTQQKIRTFAAPGVSQRLLVRVIENASRHPGGSAKGSEDSNDLKPRLHMLCRSLPQLRQAAECGVSELYADFHDIREYREAISIARNVSSKIYLATLRIHKPGERGLFLALGKQQADGWLARNLAAIAFAKQHSIPCVADFSLNVTNPLTAEWLIQLGVQRLTASYDLNRDQLVELVEAMPAKWLEVVIHQHMPMFHMEHCVFCSVLSPGTNKSNCGRPCDRHEVKLRDRIGADHILHADIGCRNTLYNGAAQSGAEVVPSLIAMGIRHFRIELLKDAPDAEVRRLIAMYNDLLAGRLAGAEVWKSLKAENRVGVTRGTLEHPRNPLAIL